MADKWIQLQSSNGEDNLFPVSKADLLWTNAASSSAGFTAEIDLSNYDFIGIFYINATDISVSARRYCFNIFPKSDISYQINATYGGKILARTITSITDSGVVFNNGAWYSAYGSATDSAYSCVPYQIYGFRKMIDDLTS